MRSNHSLQAAWTGRP